MKPLGDAFIKLIKMLIAPIIFCTVVHGIASMEDLKKVGRVGLKALIYFEVVTTLALIVGLIVVNILAARRRHERRLPTIDTKSIQVYTTKAGAAGHGRLPARASSPTPSSAPSPKARSCRSCSSPSCSRSRCSSLGERGQPRARTSSTSSRTLLFGIVGIIMKAGADRRLRRDGVHDRQSTASARCSRSAS